MGSSTRTPREAGPSLPSARRALRDLADPARAQGAAAFFQTAPGEYGHGDVFLGVTVPALRRLARAYVALPLDAVAALLASRYHEERLFALFVLERRFRGGDEGERAAVVAFYLGRLERVNNWDLVDASAYTILGAHLAAEGGVRRGDGAPRVLRRLAASESVWDRRVAIVATFAFTMRGEAAPTFDIAARLLRDPHALIHKAVGWMLREVGKRVSTDRLRAFLREHAAEMPRTALRYAIERMPDDERRQWLSVPRSGERRRRSGAIAAEGLNGPERRRSARERAPVRASRSRGG